MTMKSNSPIYIIMGAFLLLSSCTAHRQLQHGAVTAEGSSVHTDVMGKAHIQALVRVLAHMPGKRARLFVVPQLLVADSVVTEYAPLLVDRSIYARKHHRKVVLGHLDEASAPQAAVSGNGAVTLPVDADVQLPTWASLASLRAELSTTGCGQCYGADTIQLATVSNWAPLIPPVSVSLMQRPFVIRPKVVNGKGEARLQFVVDKWDIIPSMADNRAQLDSMAARLTPIFSDTLATLNSLSINGAASAEGTYRHNVMLAENRAASARQWLVSTLNLPRRYLHSIHISAQPEGWEPVLAAMTAAGCADSTAVRDILLRYPGSDDDLQERYIRRLPCWPEIRDHYLAKDRRVVYTYSYTLRNFRSDSEMLRLYTSRPDAFNEDELLRVAALQPTDADRVPIYEYTLSRYPHSALAVHNLAAISMEQGHPAEAASLIRHSGAALTDTLRSVLALACASQGEFSQTEALLGTAPRTPAMRQALGTVRALQGRMDEADSLLAGCHSAVAAIVALDLGRTAEAQRLLDQCADDVRPTVEYARAVCAYRLGRPESEVKRHLQAARADETLARRIDNENWTMHHE